VVLGTIQSAKGLEFPAVILCGPFRENLPVVDAAGRGHGLIRRHDILKAKIR
jgi:superfamily I DNA/RNA helicase